MVAWYIDKERDPHCSGPLLQSMKALTPTHGTGKRKKLTSPGALAAVGLILGAVSAPSVADTPFKPPLIKVRDGFEITLAAAPPLLKYPMMACLDDQGRLYVAESDGRNLTTRKEIEKELPRFVRRLSDTDGDGIFDQSTIFADRMTMPEGGLWHNGALYIVSAPYLWRLEDTNDDGVADKREKIIGEMEFDGRANQHGPYLGPNGRLYFSGGHFGYQFTGTDGSRTGKSRAGGIFSCLPDGSDVRIDGQGPINPVDIAFTGSGEVLSTAAIYDSFGGKRHDAFIHWFPRGLTQRLYGEPLLPQTGHRVPATIRWGQVAPAGLMRYRGTQFGDDYRDTFFACHFNSSRVRHIRLTPDGATFNARDDDFLSSPSRDFHPADILEDADGSLLLLDTGGWLSWGCPHSKAAKPEVLGAIYRIRRTGAASPSDPRGTGIPWTQLAPAQTAQLLGDPRPAVRDRARSNLISMGTKAFKTLTQLRLPAVTKKAAVRRRAVFTMSQIKSPGLGKELRSSLQDPAAEVRQAAARSLGELRTGEAVPELCAALNDEDPLLRRLAATALGRIGDRKAISPLFDSLRADSQAAFEHAVRLALIEIGDSGECLPWLRNPSPHHQTTALRVMEQIDPRSLKLEDVVPFLRSPLPLLRNEARRIVAGRTDWKKSVFALFRELLSTDQQDPSSSQLAEEIMMGFATDEEFHEMLSHLLTDQSSTESSRYLLLSCLGYLDKIPDKTTSAVGSLLRESSHKLRAEAIRLIVKSNASSRFLGRVESMAADPEEDPLIRATALEGIAGQSAKLSKDQFATAEGLLSAPASNPEVRRQAARALSRIELQRETLSQARALVLLVAGASPFHLSLLLEPFQRIDPAAWDPGDLEALGSSLAEALRRSPGRKSLTEGDLNGVSEKFTEASPRAHRAFKDLKKDNTSNSAEREQRLTLLLNISEQGNASRGRVLFHSNRSTCSLCHRIGNQGGTLGPNLSGIGAIRSAKDLFEAIVFPSATVVNGFESYLLTDTGGGAHTGLIHRETTDAIYLRQVNQQIIRIPRDEVKSTLRSPVSLMPAGLDGILSDQELADLVAYLQICK